MILVALVVGIFTIGGPNEGRREAFDRRRYVDLTKISYALHCQNLRIDQPILPNELDLETIRAYCGGVEILAKVLLDNETGTPYAFSRINKMNTLSARSSMTQKKRCVYIPGALLIRLQLSIQKRGVSQGVYAECLSGR